MGYNLGRGLSAIGQVGVGCQKEACELRSKAGAG